MQGIDVEPNVNFEAVASKLHGYSGDDITNICRSERGWRLPDVVCVVGFWAMVCEGCTILLDQEAPVHATMSASLHSLSGASSYIAQLFYSVDTEFA